MAGQVAMGETPHPSLFARKPLSSIKFPTPLQKSQPINSYTFANHPFSLFHFIKREPSPRSPSSSSTNPSSKRTPNLFTFTSRLQGLPLGLHQRAPSSINTPQSNIKNKFFNPSFNIKWWIEANTFSLGSSFRFNPSL